MDLLSFFYVFAVTSTLVVKSDATCKKDGFICRTQCKELVRCISLSNTTFSEEVVRTCPGTIGNFCNATQLNCGGGSCEDEGLLKAVITCHQDGKFPHPTSCDQYYVCNNSSPIPNIGQCPSFTSYNAAHQNCTGLATARSCLEGPIPRCTSVTDSGAYPEDHTLFYLCAYDTNGYLRPQFHRCLTGFTFDSEKSKCVTITNSAPSLRFLSSTSALILVIITLLT